LTCPPVAGDRWDQHSKLKEGHENNARAVDQPIAGLLKDLKQRGMLKDTLVIWAGEFGRTPFAQGKNGRDHNQFGFTVWMAGGGVKAGTVYGATDEWGYKAIENRLEMHDFHATMLHLMGVDHTRSETTHSFIAFGQKTYMVDADGNKTWTYPGRTRDGYVLDDGTIILTLNKSKKRHPGGAVVKITHDGKETLIYKGTQAEVNSAHPTADGTYVITEAGNKPRLLEITEDGEVLVEFPLICQTKNHHLETRMARKLDDGTYLVPHLLDFAVVHYAKDGSVIKKFDTTVEGDPERKISRRFAPAMGTL